jgi:guanylate kinase
MTQKPKPFLLVLSAPSGGGKTTICKRLLRRNAWLERCVTATTRAPRRGEKDGKDYHFLSQGEFRARVKKGGFYEWARVHGNLYGTPRREAEAALRRGKSLVLVIDVQGGAQVKRKDKESVLVFLQPPSLEVLRRRLKGRGKDSAEAVERRMREARKELRAARHYDFQVLNDRLDHAVEHVEEIARAMRWRNMRR